MTFYDSRGTHHVIKCTRPENTPTRNYNLRSMRAWRGSGFEASDCTRARAWRGRPARARRGAVHVRMRVCKVCARGAKMVRDLPHNKKNEWNKWKIISMK